MLASAISLAIAHRAVCEKFGGANGGSIRFKQSCAVETLDKFTNSRRSLIDPAPQFTQSCPFQLNCAVIVFDRAPYLEDSAEC